MNWPNDNNEKLTFSCHRHSLIFSAAETGPEPNHSPGKTPNQDTSELKHLLEAIFRTINNIETVISLLALRNDHGHRCFEIEIKTMNVDKFSVTTNSWKRNLLQCFVDKSEITKSSSGR